MSLKTLVVRVGAVTSTFSAGTTSALAVVGDTFGRATLTLGSATTALAQKFMDFKSTSLTPNSTAPGGYNAIRRELKLTYPVTLASGETVKDSITVIQRLNPETESSVGEEMRVVVAQSLTSTEHSEFWSDGRVDS